MPKTLECVWRVVNSSVIELTDEQWEAIQNDELSYYYASDDAAHFIDNEGNEIEIPVKEFYTEGDEYGMEGLFCPEIGDYVG